MANEAATRLDDCVNKRRYNHCQCGYNFLDVKNLDKHAQGGYVAKFLRNRHIGKITRTLLQSD